MNNKVTVKDIAKEAGVSPASVSFVMRNLRDGKRTYRISEKTQEKIRRIAERLNYIPNFSAQSLRSGRYNTIGVIVSDISNPFFATMARYLEDHAEEAGYRIIFGSSDEDAEKLKRYVDVFLQKGVDGFIIIPCADSEGIIRALKEQGVPVVLVDRAIDGVDSIVLDNFATAKDLCVKLIDKGYRKIRMISYSMRLSNIVEREHGYMEAMKEKGLADQIVIDRIPHHALISDVNPVIQKLKEEGTDAFIFATNFITTTCLKQIIGAGYRIPDDFGIGCFDDNEIFHLFNMDILYARQPTMEFSKQAITLLINNIKEEKIQKVNKITLPCPILKA